MKPASVDGRVRDREIFLMFRQPRHGHLRRGLRRRGNLVQAGSPWPSPSAVAGRLRQVGPVPVAGLVARAMEGPTPFLGPHPPSTMVTAGVYLIARSNPIFDPALPLSPCGRHRGALTLVIGCIVGCAKTTSSRVLAWSTGSRSVHVPVSAWAAVPTRCDIHLWPHGFLLKAGLFLRRPARSCTP